MTRVGTKLPLRSQHYDRIEAVVIDAFVHGRPYTQAALAGAMAKTFHVDEQATAERLVYYLRKLAGRGMYEAQAGRFGSKGTQAKGSPTSPRWFNWSPISVDAATLRHAVEPFLQAPEVAEWRKEAVRKVIRFRCELPTQCPDDRVLAGAAGVPAHQLYELPLAVFTEASARFSKQTAKNYRTAVRDVLQYAAKRRRIPLVFPFFFEPDAWAELTDRCFGLAEEGASSSYVRRHRYGMSCVRRAAIALYGDDVAPATLTRSRAAEIETHLRVAEGNPEGAKKAVSTLRELAESFQVGPFTEERPSDSYFIDTPHGPRPAIYLRAPDGSGVGDDWAGLLQLLGQLGFPAETIDFLRWYKTYVTMSPRDLLKRENRKLYPERRDAHRLSPNSVAQRVIALRAYLGAAVNVLGMHSQTLTPGIVFGTAFEDVAYALVDWWHDRRAALLADGRDTAIAGALGQYLVGVGMVCYTRYERLRFNRRRSIAVVSRQPTRGDADPTIRIDTVAEEGVAKTPEEQAAWDAYRTAYAIEGKLQGMVKEERGANRSGAPEFKDIKVMMENTAPSWFIRILQRAISRIRATPPSKRETYRYHKLVRDTVDLALHISTGCRSEEICLIRLDRHLAPESLAARVIKLLAAERKNNKDHEVLLQPAYLPDDILQLYLTHTRPFFMRDQYLRPHRVNGRGKLVTRPELVRDHPFLMVSSRGDAYGVEDLDDEAEVRRLAQRASDHGRNLRYFLAREAIKNKQKLPGRKYELGVHAIRGVFAYALYVLTGRIQVAAHYLGDEEATVATNYSAISGIHVDSSELIGFNVGPKINPPQAEGASEPTQTSRPSAPAACPVSPATPSPNEHDPEAAYLAKAEALLADRRAGIINARQFEELLAVYRRQYRRESGVAGRDRDAA